jgi:hypothetical protein
VLDAPYSGPIRCPPRQSGRPTMHALHRVGERILVRAGSQVKLSAKSARPRPPSPWLTVGVVQCWTLWTGCRRRKAREGAAREGAVCMIVLCVNGTTYSEIT